MKWQVILPVVAMLCLAFVPQAAEAHHHHCGYGGYGSNGYGYNGGYGMNPFAMQRMMSMQNRGYGGYGGGYGRSWGGYGNGYGNAYGNGYGGYGNGYGNGYGYGNSGAVMSGFGRLLRGF